MESQIPVEELEVNRDDGSRLFKFDKAKLRLTRLQSSCNTDDDVEEARKLRYFDTDPQALRDSKDIEEDETLINVRTINTNIEREQPAFMSFLRNSRRIVTFSRKEGKDKVNTAIIEEEFTRGVTYPGWEIPHYQRLDGAQLHGWDALEVVFDESKPFHVALDHIGNGNLLFPNDSQDIQAHEIIARKYEVTVAKLKSMIDAFGFSREQVELITQAKEGSDSEDKLLAIYKVFMRFEGVIYSAWAELKTTSDWLKDPVQHYIGWDEEVEEPVVEETMSKETIDLGLDPSMQMPAPMQKVWKHKALTEYPIFLLRYRLTEEKAIKSVKGRAFIDRPKQEALTALWSGFVNGANRASNPSASPKTASGNGGKPQQLEGSYSKGSIWSEPMDFWAPPYPDESMIRAAQNLDTMQTQEAGQLNFAVQNKRGSRTTAEEIQSADRQNTLLNSVQLTLFSVDIRECYTLVWRITQSRALQSLFPFLAYIEEEVTNPMTQEVSIVFKNDIELIKHQYEVRAAGDVDVIQRSEQMQAYAEFWPMVQQTSIAPVFMQDFIRLAFPAQGEKYADMIQKAQGDKQLIQQLLQVLAGFVSANPTLLQSASPQAQQNMQQLMEQSKIALQTI